MALVAERRTINPNAATKKDYRTKTQIILTLSVGLLLLCGFATAEDKLGTSAAELERLKELNRSGQVVSRSDEELRKLMVGKWTTGRHEYLYRADGTWQMLPADISTTNGKWRIQNRQLIEEAKLEKKYVSTGAPRTFVEVTPKQLVLRNEGGPYPFRYIRIE